MGVAHPEPPARSSGPACCPRLGFLRGGGPPSICPSAHRPLHAPLGWTVKWGAAGATVGVSPFTDGSPKLLLGTISWHSWVPAGIVVLVQPAAVGWSRQRHAPGLPAGRRVARGSCSGSCPLAPWVQPPTALLTGGPAGAELPMGPPAAGPPQLPPPRRRCRPPAAVVLGTSDRFYGFSGETAWQETEQKHRPRRAPPPTLLPALPPPHPAPHPCTGRGTPSPWGTMGPGPTMVPRGCLVQGGPCPVGSPPCGGAGETVPCGTPPGGGDTIWRRL